MRVGEKIDGGCDVAHGFSVVHRIFRLRSSKSTFRIDVDVRKFFHDWCEQMDGLLRESTRDTGSKIWMTCANRAQDLNRSRGIHLETMSAREVEQNVRDVIFVLVQPFRKTLRIFVYLSECRCSDLENNAPHALGQHRCGELIYVRPHHVQLHAVAKRSRTIHELHELNVDRVAVIGREMREVDRERIVHKARSQVFNERRSPGPLVLFTTERFRTRERTDHEMMMNLEVTTDRREQKLCKIMICLDKSRHTNVGLRTHVFLLCMRSTFPVDRGQMTAIYNIKEQICQFMLFDEIDNWRFFWYSHASILERFQVR